MQGEAGGTSLRATLLCHLSDRAGLFGLLWAGSEYEILELSKPSSHATFSISSSKVTVYNKSSSDNQCTLHIAHAGCAASPEILKAIRWDLS